MAPGPWPMTVPPHNDHAHVQVKDTPNPNSLMFYPGVDVLESGTMNFESGANAHQSPLARALFRLDGVSFSFSFDCSPSYLPDALCVWPILFLTPAGGAHAVGMPVQP